MRVARSLVVGVLGFDDVCRALVLARVQVLRDVVGAVFGVTFSRFALAISSYWQTTNPNSVWLVQLARLSTCIPLCVAEQLIAQTLFPGNAGSSLFHAFLLANMLIMTGSVRARYFGELQLRNRYS